MFEEEKLENQPQSTPQRRDGKVATDIASIFGEEKTSELPKPSDNIFITPDGKKISYNQEEVDNLRIKTTFQKLMQDTKDKIEQAPSDVEEREYGSEGVIYRVKLFIGGIEQYIIAMKLRYDNAITHEAEMLKTANNLVMLGDEYGEGEGERAKVPDLYGTITANDLKNPLKKSDYLLMEYIDGKTLYTLILETIIKTLKAKIQKISLYSFEEWKEEGMKQFQKEWKAEKQKAISGAKSLCAINIESMEASYVRLPKKIREQSIQNERNKYGLELQTTTKNIDERYSLKGPYYKQESDIYQKKLREKFDIYINAFDDYRNTFLKEKEQFANDNTALQFYTNVRDKYYACMKECKPIIKGGLWEIPDISGRGLLGRERSEMMHQFCQWVANENLPIFSKEEVARSNACLKKTLDIFHSNDFYHGDLGTNPRNLMFKTSKTGEIVPVIIDFGHSVIDGHYPEDTESYMPDEQICGCITSGEQ